MDWTGWALFGGIATIVLTATMVGAQLAGLTRMDMPLMLGALFTDDPDRAHIAGLVIHLANGQLFALAYTAAFWRIGWASWWLGALFGLVHGLCALVVLVPSLPSLHPRMASERAGPELPRFLEPPGPLALNYGRETPAVTLVAHILFGALLGGFVRPL